MQLVNRRLEQRAYIVADSVWDVEALGPADQGARVDTSLAHGETEGEAQIEQVFFLVAITSSALVGFKVVVVVDAQEGLDLAGQEEEQVLGGAGSHEFPGDHDLGLGEGESGVAVQLNRADAKVGATEVDGQVETLMRQIRD